MPVRRHQRFREARLVKIVTHRYRAQWLGRTNLYCEFLGSKCLLVNRQHMKNWNSHRICAQIRLSFAIKEFLPRSSLANFAQGNKDVDCSASSGKLDELYGRSRESKKNLEFACPS